MNRLYQKLCSCGLINVKLKDLGSFHTYEMLTVIKVVFCLLNDSLILKQCLINNHLIQ